LIQNGIIKKIGEIDIDESLPIIDAQNQYLLPGAIDPHVHFHLKTRFGRNADTFESGSRAALAGGTTTIIDFITPEPGEDLTQALLNRKGEIKNIYTDYHFHQSITEWNQDTASQMQHCVENLGIHSFKTYLTYRSTIGIDDKLLEKVMQKAATLDALVLVHAEDGEEIDSLIKKFKYSPKSPANIHMKTHPVSSEVNAIKKVVALCEKTRCKTYIVHVSTAEGMQCIYEAKKNGTPIFAETCTQYYLMHDTIYKRKDEFSILNILSPPLRPITERNSILQGLMKDDYIDCLSTDHCPFTKGMKLIPDHQYKDIPHGIGGVQFRNLLFHQHFIFKSLLPWQKMAELTAENAAKIFNLPNKGKIEEGFDADLVLYKELPKSIKIKQLRDYSLSDINVYKNQNIQAEIQWVIKAGKVVYQDGEFKSDLEQGNFLKV